MQDVKTVKDFHYFWDRSKKYVLLCTQMLEPFYIVNLSLYVTLVSPLKIVKNGIICKNINSTTQKIHLAFDLKRTIHILKYFQRP
jgi:hypothetical protein